MSSDFDDIEIVDLDVAKTTWSRVHSSMRTVYLRLSREPDVAWTRQFLEERGKRMNPKRHGLWIEDSYIVIDCFVDEIEQFHLPDLRRSIDFANARSRERIDRTREQLVESQEDARNERIALDALRARIRRDAPVPVRETDVEPPIASPFAAQSPAAPVDESFVKKRGDWKARFRAALALRNKESGRGND
ncbi:MAG TPA: hypothetical protein VH375_02165 [Rhodanobacteraceae bacterium]|jgi:hypothetical protein